MSYEFTTIEPIIKHDEVKKTIRKYRSDYNQLSARKKDKLKVPQLIKQQKESMFVLKTIASFFQGIFISEYEHIIDVLQKEYDSNLSVFNNQLLDIYKRLKLLYYPIDLENIPAYNLENTPINDKYLFQVNETIRFYLQKLFIIPLISFIEENYLYDLGNINIYPMIVDNIFDEIKADKLSFEKLLGENKAEKNYVVYSDINKVIFYFTYNSFANINSYKKHLDNVYSEFEQYIRNLKSIENDDNIRLSFLNKIRLNLIELKGLFSTSYPSKANKKQNIPFYLRKTTYTVYQQMLKTNHLSSSNNTFSPAFFDFQDLQYHILFQALLSVESEIKVLRFEMKRIIKHRNTTSTKTYPEFSNNKLKTKLSVPQISYFLRCLEHEKGIIDIDNKADLFRKVAGSISSARQDNISLDSLKNKFNMPDENAIEFWIEMFTHLLQFSKKERDNLRS